MAIQVYCNCGNPLIVPTDLAGRKVKCKVCQTVLKIPDATPGAAPEDNEAEKLSQSGEYEVVGEDAIQLSCPSCGALAAPEDTACLSCGADLGGGGRRGGGVKLSLPSLGGGKLPKPAMGAVAGLVVVGVLGFGAYQLYQLSRPGSLASDGFAALARGDHRAARQAFQEALTYDAQHDEAQIGMAEVAVAEQKDGDIRRFVPNAVKAIPDARRRAPLRLALAWVFLADERFRDAYNEAIEAQDDDPTLSGVDDVRGLAMVGLEEADDAYDVLKAASRQGSKDYRVHFALAQLQREREEWSAAQTSAERAAELRDDDPEIWWLLAELLEQNRRNDAAKRALKTLIELQPENAAAHSRLSGLHLADNQYDEALAASKQAQALDPNDLETAISVGRILLAQEKYAEAQTELTRAMNIGESWRCEFLLAEALLYGGDTNNAARRFQAALDKRPEDMVLHMKAARLALEHGMHDKAQAWSKLVVGNEGENFDAHLLYARALAAQDRTRNSTKIIQHLETAMSLAPENGMAPLELGQHFMELVKPEEALLAFDKGLEASPSDKELLYWKGRACIRTKSWDAAVETLERLKRLSPSYKDVDNWLRRAEEGRFYNE